MAISADAQAEKKHKLVSDAFGGAAQIAPLVRAEQTERYRSKVVLVARSLKGRTIFGGYKRASHHVLDLDGCVIEEPILARVAQWLRRSLKDVRAFDDRNKRGDLRYVVMRSTKSGEALVTWLGAKEPRWARGAAKALLAEVPGVRGVFWAENTSDGNAIWGSAAPKLLAGVERIEDNVSGLRFTVSPRAFFQVHRAQAERLREAIVAAVPERSVVWDLYCGVGVNALVLAERGASVIGLESVADAVRDAEENARLNALTARFVVSDLERALPELPRPNVVVVNPPRKGAPKALIDAIAAQRPERIVYVACAPKPVAAAHGWLAGYRARSITPYDLFPHTEQVETLAIFDRI